MADPELARRAEISRRLKAARWLAGSIDRDHQTKNGRPNPLPRALSPKELAERQPLKENAITANRIGEIERLERPIFPMEIDAIAQALEIPASFFFNAEINWPEEDVGPRGGGLRRELLGDQPNQEDRPDAGEHRDEGHQSNGDA